MATSPRDVFAHLYATHGQAAVRMATALCGEPELAEDCVAEAVSHMYPKWVAGEIADFGPYLRRAVANQVHGAFRRRRTARCHEARRCVDGTAVESPEERIIELAAVCSALRELPLHQRRAVVLHYLEDRRLVDVAAAMGTTLGTAKAHVSRGRARLRVVLEQSSGRARSLTAVRAL